jgi:hypothetical protein
MNERTRGDTSGELACVRHVALDEDDLLILGQRRLLRGARCAEYAGVQVERERTERGRVDGVEGPGSIIQTILLMGVIVRLPLIIPLGHGSCLP